MVQEGVREFMRTFRGPRGLRDPRALRDSRAKKGNKTYAIEKDFQRFKKSMKHYGTL